MTRLSFWNDFHREIWYFLIGSRRELRRTKCMEVRRHSDYFKKNWNKIYLFMVRNDYLTQNDQRCPPQGLATICPYKKYHKIFKNWISSYKIPSLGVNRPTFFFSPSREYFNEAFPIIWFSDQTFQSSMKTLRRSSKNSKLEFSWAIGRSDKKA